MISLTKENACTSPAAMKKGATIVTMNKRGKIKMEKIKDILNPGTEHVEILLNRKKNTYFSWACYMDGTSFITRVWVVKCQ